MEVGERLRGNERQCFRVIVFGFAGKTSDDVGADGSMR